MLVPVWSVSPYLMTGLLPVEQTFDAVVILDAEATSLQAVLPAIARARQVIAFGDDQIASPRTFTVGRGAARRRGDLPPGRGERLPGALRRAAGVEPADRVPGGG